MIGPFNSNVAKSEIPLTNDAGLVQISPSNTNDGLTVGDGAAALRSSHPDVNAYFRVCTNDSNQGGALAQYARKLDYKKMFIIDDNETYGKGLADSFEAHFTKLGGTVLGHEHITANQQDFKALLTKVKSLAPDAVFFGGNTSTGGGLLRRQMADVGMNAVGYMGGDGISDPEFLSTAGTMANGTYFSVAAPDATKLASAKTFVAAYRARFKQDVGGYSASAYAATNVLIAAIAKAVAADGGKLPTRAEVLANVAATKDFPTPIGPVGFDKNGDSLNPSLTLQEVRAGKVVTVAVITLKG
jgi:branched-chain amino acid transport system substrate-binding protein